MPRKGEKHKERMGGTELPLRDVPLKCVSCGGTFREWRCGKAPCGMPIVDAECRRCHLKRRHVGFGDLHPFFGQRVR